MILSATETVLLNTFGGGVLDWDYLDRLVEDLYSAGYELSIMDDENFFQESGLVFNEIVYCIFWEVAYEFGVCLADCLELEKDDGFIIDVIDELSNGIYPNFMCSCLDVPFEDEVMRRDVEEFVELFVEKDELGNFSLNVEI